MKRIPVLSVVLFLAILGGFLLLFPAEWVGGLLLLVGLLVFQIVVVRRNLHVIRSRRPPAGLPSKEPAQVSAFDPALFSRFRAQLEAAEGAAVTETAVAPPPVDAAGEPGAAPPSGSGHPDSTEESGGDRVVLSPAARKKAREPKKKALQTPLPDDAETAPGPAAEKDAEKAAGPEEGVAPGEEDLFADLRPHPQPLQAASPESGQKPERKPAELLGAPQAQPEREQDAGEGQRGRGRKAAPESTGDEVGAVLEAEEAEEAREGPSSEEGAMLLKMAEDALEQGDAAGAQAGLEQAMVLYEALPGGAPLRARLAQARLAVLEHDHGAALERFEQLLKEQPELEEAQTLATMEQLLAPLEGQEAASLKVSLLLKMLAALRQANDRRGMDRVYGLIEEAQEEAGDEQKLIQYFKNHLEIKKVLEDVEGQLALIDRIGNRYYKLGDTQTAREFYEQGLKLRGEQEAASGEG